MLLLSYILFWYINVYIAYKNVELVPYFLQFSATHSFPGKSSIEQSIVG